MARATTKRTGLARRIERARTEAERAVGRGYQATLELLPSGSRTVVRDLAKQLEATAAELGKRRTRALKALEQRRRLLTGRVEDAIRTVERRRHRALKDVERRGAQLAAAVETRIAAALRPVLRRLDLATVSDIERLGRRLAQIERKLNGTGRRRAA